MSIEKRPARLQQQKLQTHNQSPRQQPQQQSIPQAFRDTLESLVMALILAFVFRAFIVEAFVIPTGSMADTLRGAHFPLTCPTCGYQYNYGYNTQAYGAPRGTLPSKPVNLAPPGHLRPLPICPLCGTPANNTHPYWVSNGDRILVLKYIYQFVEPKIWDVVVFKNPTNPAENYIKRLIGTPGDTVEIIDGDVYINGIIQTKPPHVQNALWIRAFDNDYQPDDAHAQKMWQEPFEPATDKSSWTIDQQRHLFSFGGSAKRDSLLFNRTRLQNILNSFCAYNGLPGFRNAIVSDLKLTFMFTPRQNNSQIAIRLGKYKRTYTATVTANGSCSITSDTDGKILVRNKIAPLQIDHPVMVSFANIDHQLKLCVGSGSGNMLYWKGPNSPLDWGYQPDKPHPLPSVAIMAQGGKCQLEHIALFRDIYYTSFNNGRGTEGHPFKLKKNQFFVMGDNSPESYDSRYWNTEGVGNNGKTFRMGIVPREYLIGRAFFVYWPAAWRLTPNSKIPFVPNVGDMRFIH